LRLYWRAELTDLPKLHFRKRWIALLWHYKALILAKNVLYIDLSDEYEKRRHGCRSPAWEPYFSRPIPRIYERA
jgi:hypothetical protein